MAKFFRLSLLARLVFAFCLVATGAFAQSRPPASECLAMAQAVPGARYASFDTKAFSSEVGTGSRQENASKQARAFSSEVGTGSRQENASRQNALPFIRVAATRSEVTITYIGHSTYVIDTAGGIRIATDYNGYYHVPGRLPDVVTMNRAHSTHYTLSPDPRIKHVLHGWADDGSAARHEVVLDDILIRNVTTDIRFGFGGFNNSGAPMQRDGNSIFIFEVAGLCIGHLGHLHHRLEDIHIAEIGRLDIVMVPIDGGLTLSLDGMSDMAKRLRSSVVLPMHRLGTPMEDFISRVRAQFEIDRRTERSFTISRETLPKTPTIVILDGV